jgi:hypothetical protein
LLFFGRTASGSALGDLGEGPRFLDRKEWTAGARWDLVHTHDALAFVVALPREFRAVVEYTMEQRWRPSIGTTPASCSGSTRP